MFEAHIPGTDLATEKVNMIVVNFSRLLRNVWWIGWQKATVVDVNDVHVHCPCPLHILFFKYKITQRKDGSGPQEKSSPDC